MVGWVDAVEKFWEQEYEEDLEKFTADFINKLAETLKPECIRSLVKGADMYVPSDPHEAYKMGG